MLEKSCVNKRTLLSDPSVHHPKKQWVEPPKFVCEACGASRSFIPSNHFHLQNACGPNCLTRKYKRIAAAQRRKKIKEEFPWRHGKVVHRNDLVEERNFYLTPAWKRLRYLAIVKHGKKCKACGAFGNGLKLHVDHIKPRSKYPELQLEISNLQVLCEPCNMGKGAWDETDHR